MVAVNITHWMNMWTFFITHRRCVGIEAKKKNTETWVQQLEYTYFDLFIYYI
jgi:hypothetical protein